MKQFNTNKWFKNQYLQEANLYEEKADLAAKAIIDDKQLSLEDVQLPGALAQEAGVLGQVQMSHILDCKGAKGWIRKPSLDEILIVNDDSGTAHSCRVPRAVKPGQSLSQVSLDESSTWCGWTFGGSGTTLVKWDAQREGLRSSLCARCFGKPFGTQQDSSTASSSESSG